MDRLIAQFADALAAPGFARASAGATPG